MGLRKDEGGRASTKGHQTCPCPMEGLLGQNQGGGPSANSRLRHLGLRPQHLRSQRGHSREVGTGRPSTTDAATQVGRAGSDLRARAVPAGAAVCTPQVRSNSRVRCQCLAEALFLETSCPGLSCVKGTSRKGLCLCQVRVLMGAVAAEAGTPVGGPRMRQSITRLTVQV